MELALAVHYSHDVLELKGFNDVTSLLHARDGDTESTAIAVNTGESTDDDFEDLPNFAVLTS